jgi:LPXTG-motif cell wall-anchored protein
MTVSPRIAAVSTFSTAGLLFGAALLPAGSAFAASYDCGSGATLVADGICEVTFTEDGTWTPPAGITKLQALIVGGGGHGGPASGDAYAGGAGEVRLVELSTSGEVEISVGTGGTDITSSGGDTSIAQGSTSEIADGGEVGAPGGSDIGGASGSGYVGDTYNYGGAGAGGNADGNSGGVGVVINEIDPVVFTLFANDDRCLGGGGAGTWGGIYSGADVYLQSVSATCGGGYPEAPDSAALVTSQWVWTGSLSDATLIEPTPNSGGGAGAMDIGTLEYTDGADGVVTFRYDVQLAETGFDATGSIVAGAALVAGGAVVATRRRRNA